MCSNWVKLGVRDLQAGWVLVLVLVLAHTSHTHIHRHLAMSAQPTQWRTCAYLLAGIILILKAGSCAYQAYQPPPSLHPSLQPA